MSDIPKLGSSDGDIHSWVTSLLDDGRRRRLYWEGQWWLNLATFAGDLWAQWNPHKARLEEPEKEPHQVRLPINLAQPIIRTEKAKLTKNRPIPNCIAKDDTKSSLNSAKVGDLLLNYYCEQKFNLPKVRRRMLDWVLVTGLGGIFVDFDETLGDGLEVLTDPNGNPVFDERVIAAAQADKNSGYKTEVIPQGEMVVKQVSPMQVIWDFSEIYIEDASWLIVSDVYDCAEIRKRWGKEVNPEHDALPGIIEQRLLMRVDYSQRMTVQTPRAQDMAKVHRMFIKPGHYYFPDGAEIVFTDNEILQKRKFPFRHGTLPIRMMGHIAFPISQYPMSTLQQIRAVVLEISRTESQMVENRNLMANPPWVEAKQSRVEGTIRNRPSHRIIYNHVPNIPPPQPITMPELPGYVHALLETLRNHVLEISGQGETSQGRVPAGARSGVAIAYLQEEDDTRLGPTVSEFEETIEGVSWLMLMTIAEKYTTQRTIQIFRKHGAPEVFDFIGTHLEGVSGVQVQAGSALPRSKAAKQQFILDLWDRGLEQDPRKVREMLELSAGEPDEWELDINQADRENRKMQQGEVVEVEEWHNHPAHHYQHRAFMKSPDFEALNDEIKELFRRHDAQHTEFEQAQQLESAMMQQGGGDPSMPVEPTEEDLMGNPIENNPSDIANGMPNQSPNSNFIPDITPRSLLDEVPQ